MQLQTKFAGELGEVVALHLISSSPIAFGAKGCTCTSVESLKVTKGGARCAPFPQVGNVSIRKRLSHFEQSGSDGGVPEVMIRAWALHIQGKILNGWVGLKSLVKHSLSPTSPPRKDLLDIDPLANWGLFIRGIVSGSTGERAGSQDPSLAANLGLWAMTSRTWGRLRREKLPQGLGGVKVDGPPVSSNLTN